VDTIDDRGRESDGGLSRRAIIGASALGLLSVATACSAGAAPADVVPSPRDGTDPGGRTLARYAQDYLDDLLRIPARPGQPFQRDPGSCSSGTPGGVRRRGPANWTGEARSLHIGSVSTLSGPSCSSVVA